MVPTSRSWLRPRHHLALRSTHKAVTCRAHNALMCALRKAATTSSGAGQGSADVLYIRALALRRGACERDDCIERMSPEVIEGPPPRVLGLCAGCDQNCTLHAVAALGVPALPRAGSSGSSLSARPSTSSRSVRVDLHARYASAASSMSTEAG